MCLKYGGNIKAVKMSATIQGIGELGMNLDESAAKPYIALCQKCANAEQVMILTRALPDAVQSVAQAAFQEDLEYRELLRQMGQPNLSSRPNDAIAITSALSDLSFPNLAKPDEGFSIPPLEELLKPRTD